VPGEGPEFGWLSFGTIAPGFVGEVPFAPEVCCPGVYIDYVVDGSYRLRVDQPFRVRPGGEPGRWIEQPAGTEVTLGPGDAVAYRLPSGYAITNLGVTPVHVVSAGLVSGSLSSVQIEQPVMTHLSDIFPEPAAELGAVELTLRREALAAEGTLPAPTAGSYQATVGGPGNPELGQRGDGSVKNLRDEARPVYVLTLRPTAGQGDAGSA
jgi:hypothetical protein